MKHFIVSIGDREYEVEAQDHREAWGKAAVTFVVEDLGLDVAAREDN